MKRARKNPDRDARADEKSGADLRELLNSTEAADLLDEAVCHRLGHFIARAVFDPNKQAW